MFNNIRQYSRFIATSTILTMLAQMVFVCCSLALASPEQSSVQNILFETTAVNIGEDTGCHSDRDQSLTKASDSEKPSPDSHCEHAGDACCDDTQGFAILDVQQPRLLITDGLLFDFNSVVAALDCSPLGIVSQHRILKQFQTPHRTTPYYLSNCAFLE